MVPESCQRTDGIDAWLDIKADKEAKRMEKEEKRRDRKESFQHRPYHRQGHLTQLRSLRAILFVEMMRPCHRSKDHCRI